MSVRFTTPRSTIVHTGYAYAACGIEVPENKTIVTGAVTCKACISELRKGVDDAIRGVRHAHLMLENALLPTTGESK